MNNPENNFQKLNLILPPAPKPKGVYKPILTVDNLIYLSGHGPVLSNSELIIGKIGKDFNKIEGKKAAFQVGLTMLATLRTKYPNFNQIKRVIKILGMVNCTTDFENHPYIINGCSELFTKIWGEEFGIGVRSAVGMGSLPDNIPVEIEAQFQLNYELNK